MAGHFQNFRAIAPPHPVLFMYCHPNLLPAYQPACLVATVFSTFRGRDTPYQHGDIDPKKEYQWLHLSAEHRLLQTWCMCCAWDISAACAQVTPCICNFYQAAHANLPQPIQGTA